MCLSSSPLALMSQRTFCSTPPSVASSICSLNRRLLEAGLELLQDPRASRRRGSALSRSAALASAPNHRLPGLAYCEQPIVRIIATPLKF